MLINALLKIFHSLLCTYTLLSVEGPSEDVTKHTSVPEHHNENLKVRLWCRIGSWALFSIKHFKNITACYNISGEKY